VVVGGGPHPVIDREVVERNLWLGLHVWAPVDEETPPPAHVKTTICGARDRRA
jgi:hypothetical protein